MTNRRAILAPLALAASIAPLGAAPVARAATPSVARLADGTELILVRIQGSPTTSMRWVVRAGGSSDPAEKAGLAHLLEHLVFHGTYDITEQQLFDEARRAGAYLNAFTSPDYTYYVLDAPAARFPELAARYVQTITDPALTMADIERERGVVATERMLRPEVGLLWIADQLLFPGVTRGATVIGTSQSREHVTIPDLVRFYAENYVPSNTSVIIVGDIGLDQARALLEENSRLPPDGAEQARAARRGDANIPIQEKTIAAYPVTMFGYDLSGTRLETCRELASLLDLRLAMAVQVERPLASSVHALCTRLREHDFLIATAASHSYEGGALPAVLAHTFAEVARRGPTSREKQLIRSRFKHLLEVQLRSPRDLADALVPEAATAPRPAVARTFDAVFRVPELDGATLARAARSAFRDDRRLLIHMSPFGG